MKFLLLSAVLMALAMPSLAKSVRSTSRATYTDAELLDISKQLHTLDSAANGGNGLTVVMDLQGAQTTAGDYTDRAPNDLFVSNHFGADFNRSTFLAAFELFEIYTRNVTIADPLTAEQIGFQDAFIQACSTTGVLQTLRQFLAQKGEIPSSESEFRQTLNTIWFGRWAEAVPTGYHNWAYFYDEEDHLDAEYLGYINVTPTSTVTILSVPVLLYGSNKPYTEFMVGASPELELALGTLCFYARPNAACRLQSADNVAYTYDVHTIDYNGATYIESAHPTYEL